MLWCHQRSLLLRPEERDVVRPEESAVANRGAEPPVCCQHRRLLCCCAANRQCGGPQQEFGRFGRKSVRFRRELGRFGREFGTSRPAGLAGLPPKYYTKIIPPTTITVLSITMLPNESSQSELPCATGAAGRPVGRSAKLGFPTLPKSLNPK